MKCVRQVNAKRALRTQKTAKGLQMQIELTMGTKGMPEQVVGWANLAVVLLVDVSHLGGNTFLICSTAARNVDSIKRLIVYAQKVSVLLALQDGITIMRKRQFVKLALVLRIRAAATAKTA